MHIQRLTSILLTSPHRSLVTSLYLLFLTHIIFTIQSSESSSPIHNQYYSPKQQRHIDEGPIPPKVGAGIVGDDIHRYVKEHTEKHRFTAKTCKPLQESELENLFAHVDTNTDTYVKELAQAVKIPSISAYPKDYPQLLKITTWTQTKLEEMGFETRIQFVQRKRTPNGRGGNARRKSYSYSTRGERVVINHSNDAHNVYHTGSSGGGSRSSSTDGRRRDKRHGIMEFFPPPFLFAEYPSNKERDDNGAGQPYHHPINVTLLIYAHLDVVPAQKSDGWRSDPFILTRRGHILYGRGTSDDKGPLLAWLSAIQAFIDLNICLPIRFKFFIEAMEESGSVGMQRILHQEKAFFKDVTYAVLSDNFCPNPQRPCLTYGLRGLVYFWIEVKSAAEDLHSGIYGGSVSEAMQELIALLSQLTDSNGTILIPGLYDDLQEFSASEASNYANFTFDLEEYQKSVGSLRLLHGDSKIETLAHKWRLPSLSIHGIEGAFAGPGAKTVIPHRVIGKFSIRIVPNQKIKKVKKNVISYITDLHERMRTGSHFSIHISEDIEAWITDPHHINFELASRAIERVYGISPDICRDGGTIPAALYLSKILPNPDGLILIPLATAENGAHSEKEHIDLRQFLKGVKSLIAYIYEISRAHENTTGL